MDLPFSFETSLYQPLILHKPPVQSSVCCTVADTDNHDNARSARPKKITAELSLPSGHLKESPAHPSFE